ncbi:MAG: DEAD/DEAH box helicase family protein [Nitrospira sp.]|nr:DEAD/DEAH box helicase family protein [Nitrospira sp.]
MIDNSGKLKLPRAEPDEPINIISFVVTKAGWETLKERIEINSSNPVRILTRLIYKSANELIEQPKADWHWHHLPNNHAKVILYRKQKVAVLGSFNLTQPSLSSNIECLYRVNDSDYYTQLADKFDEYWRTTEKSKAAIVTREAVGQAIADTLDDREEEATGQEAPMCQADPTEGGPRRPWSFQDPIIQQVMAWLESAKDANLGRIVKLPTGAGKTLVAAEVIRRLLEKRPEARILWVCHRVELLRQSWKSVSRQLNGSIPEKTWFVPHHIQDESGVRSDRKEFRRSKECQVVFCTQGMLHHLRHNRQVPFDLVVVDECHRFHPQSTKYKVLHNDCRRESIPRLGLTATPLDRDKRNFGTYWNTESMFGSDRTEKFLVGEGFLSRRHPTLTKQWPTGFTFVCKKEHAGPEHVESELMTRVMEFDNPKVNDEVEKAWQEYCGKRQRVLCFAVTIGHANTLKSNHFAKDDSVRVAHSELTIEENRMNLIWFMDPDAPETRMLVSVLMLAEGIDLPKTDCLFMVRPTFSPELHQQMIGRGMRGPKAAGTEDYAVVDFTSQYVDQKGQVLRFQQVTANGENDVMVRVDGTVAEEDEELDDLDASGLIKTVKDLRKAVVDLQDTNGITVSDALEALAQDLDCPARTLLNYCITKADDYTLGCEDPEAELAEQSDDSRDTADRGSEVNGPRAVTRNTLAEGLTGAEGNVTRNKLLDLRAYNPQRFEEIASLTNVASSTLRSYCSDQENFRRWKTNNKDKMDQVRVILAEFLSRHSDAA